VLSTCHSSDWPVTHVISSSVQPMIRQMTSTAAAVSSLAFFLSDRATICSGGQRHARFKRASSVCVWLLFHFCTVTY
jgi:hypothetical protein